MPDADARWIFCQGLAWPLAFPSAVRSNYLDIPFMKDAVRCPSCIGSGSSPATRIPITIATAQNKLVLQRGGELVVAHVSAYPAR